MKITHKIVTPSLVVTAFIYASLLGLQGCTIVLSDNDSGDQPQEVAYDTTSEREQTESIASLLSLSKEQELLYFELQQKLEREDFALYQQNKDQVNWFDEQNQINQERLRQAKFEKGLKQILDQRQWIQYLEQKAKIAADQANKKSNKVYVCKEGYQLTENNVCLLDEHSDIVNNAQSKTSVQIILLDGQRHRRHYSNRLNFGYHNYFWDPFFGYRHYAYADQYYWPSYYRPYGGYNYYRRGNSHRRYHSHYLGRKAMGPAYRSSRYKNSNHNNRNRDYSSRNRNDRKNDSHQRRNRDNHSNAQQPRARSSDTHASMRPSQGHAKKHTKQSKTQNRRNQDHRSRDDKRQARDLEPAQIIRSQSKKTSPAPKQKLVQATVSSPKTTQTRASLRKPAVTKISPSKSRNRKDYNIP